MYRRPSRTVDPERLSGLPTIAQAWKILRRQSAQRRNYSTPRCTTTSPLPTPGRPAAVPAPVGGSKDSAGGWPHIDPAMRFTWSSGSGGVGVRSYRPGRVDGSHMIAAILDVSEQAEDSRRIAL